MIKKIKDSFWKVGNYIFESVTMPWKLHQSVKSLDTDKFFNSPFGQWIMYLLSYILLMSFGFNVVTVVVAVIFSYIIMSVNIKYNFYHIAYVCIKAKIKE